MPKGLFGRVNELARDTGWLHAPMQAYAAYGLLLFAALLVLGWWTARDRGHRRTAAALWAGAGTLLARPLTRLVRALARTSLRPMVSA